jgi:hypothetical protein
MSVSPAECWQEGGVASIPRSRLATSSRSAENVYLVSRLGDIFRLDPAA